MNAHKRSPGTTRVRMDRIALRPKSNDPSSARPNEPSASVSPLVAHFHAAVIHKPGPCVPGRADGRDTESVGKECRFQMSVGSAAPTRGRRRSTRERRPGFIEPLGSLFLASPRAAHAAISGSMPSTLTEREQRQMHARGAHRRLSRSVPVEPVLHARHRVLRRKNHCPVARAPAPDLI